MWEKVVRDSVGQDINGAELLYDLLNAPWLQSLLKVYECLQQYLKRSTMPYLSYASGLSLEILSDLRALPYPSHEARELYALLTEPHLQALLSAHDVVGLKDYEPILPPLPEDLPVDEEAMRIVCLVKNKQPLKRRVGRGIRSHWDTLRQRFIPAQRAQSVGISTKKHDGAPLKLTNNPAEVPSSPNHVPLRPQLYSKNAAYCKLCENSAFGNPSLSCSAPCVCSPMVIDDNMDSMDTEDDPDMTKPLLSVHPHYTLTPYTRISHSYLTPCCCPPSTGPPVQPRMARYSRTAPPSPMHLHRLVEAMENPPVELAKQESLDELRSTVQQAASRMERSSQDVQVLGQRMADATERMSESVQENAHALALLAQVVEKLQGLVTASSAASVPPAATAVHGEEACKESTDGIARIIQISTQSGNAPRTVIAHGAEAANPCGSSSGRAKLQALVAGTSTASAPRTAAVKFMETSEETMDEKACYTEMSTWGRNTNPCSKANASPSVHPSRAISTKVCASPVYSTPTHHSRCPSCSSSSSSSSSSSISIPLEQAVASRGRLSEKASPKGVVKTAVSPRRREHRQCAVLNGLEESSSSQNLRDSCTGIGCLSNQKKKKKKKKK
ncbi:uncharacterized protein [Salminus brasiliensis]|uniref:uncharacterized protein isoform X3 n=1 Tax=Salminus brasiliensis TaxID=930266 RepID=UPI003B82E71A